MVIQVRDLKDSFQLLLAGMLIGVGMIIPGVSGGVMAVIFGIYEPIIAVIAIPSKLAGEYQIWTAACFGGSNQLC